jgi:RimJ/RimL family protein N-acetyltransferase
MIRFTDVYEPGNFERNVGILYQLLKEREPNENISHREMPTLDQHLQFVLSRPYRDWYIVNKFDTPVGAIYLSKDNEIGIWVLKEHRKNGHGAQAVTNLMQKYRGWRLKAHVAPGNLASHSMFRALGFKPLQMTYFIEETS